MHNDKDKWIEHINHAFKQWQLATGGFITLEREAGECADYTPFIEGIAREIKTGLDHSRPIDEIKDAVRGLLITYGTTGIKRGRNYWKIGDAHRDDLLRSEVHMIRDRTGPVSYTFRTDRLRKDSLFVEIAKDIGYEDCAGGCTVDSSTRDDQENEVRRSDIFLVESVHDRIPVKDMPEVNIPRVLIDLTGIDRIDFNTCPNTMIGYNYPYSSLVHEAGHALGIGGASDAMGQDNHHPNEDIHSAIMSYGGRLPKCSPHPLDIMAIFALYQTQ